MRAERKGFTLIEALVVLLVVGILAAITIAKFAAVKEEAYIASMKADLHNLAIYQAIYRSDNPSYFAGDGSAQGFVATPGVTVANTNDPGPPPTWAATAIHRSTARTCVITTAGPAISVIRCN